MRALYAEDRLKRDSVRSSEAGLKYFVLGGLASGMLLYGASLRRRVGAAMILLVDFVARGLG